MNIDKPLTVVGIVDVMEPGDTFQDIADRLDVARSTVVHHISMQRETWRKELWRAWDEALYDAKGWLHYSDIEALLPIPATFPKNFEKYQEHRDNLGLRKIRRTHEKGMKSTKYYLPRRDLDYDSYLEELNERGEELFREAIGGGRSPSVVAASAMYVSEDGTTTQAELAETFDCSTVGIRNCIKEEGMRETVEIEEGSD